MSNFTAGEWKAFYGEKFHTISQAHADDEQGHDYGNGELIAHVVQWHKGHDWANARLIAAAPEMYRLLQNFCYPEEPYDTRKAELSNKVWELLRRIDDEEEITAHEGTE